MPFALTEDPMVLCTGQMSTDPQGQTTCSGSLDARNYPSSELLVHDFDRADLKPVTSCTAIPRNCPGQIARRVERHACKFAQAARLEKMITAIESLNPLHFSNLEASNGQSDQRARIGTSTLRSPDNLSAGRSYSKQSYAEHAASFVSGRCSTAHTLPR
jgi:hypothetical protein